MGYAEEMAERKAKERKMIINAVVGSIVGVFALILAFASTVTVGTGEIAVMTRFGEVTGQELGEGFHFKNPLDYANIYDVKVQKDEADAAAASRDLQDVNSKIVINYNLQPGKVSEIHRTVGTLYKEKIIDPAVQEVFKASAAKFDATELITDRSGVKNDAQELLAERLDRYGINLTDLSITNFSFSKDFANAIESKQVAQQNAERAKFRLEAAKTDAQAQEVQAKTLSPLYLQNEAIKKWNGKMPTYIGGGTVFNIPLE